MLKLKEVKPVFNQILVTEELYGYDDKDYAGIIIHRKGDIKPYQKVIAVGNDVRNVKPGDTVAINFYKYAELQEDPNSLKALKGNKMVKLRLNEVELTDENDELFTCFIIDERDVKYVMPEGSFEEVVYKKDGSQVTLPNGNNLILPNNKLRV